MLLSDFRKPTSPGRLEPTTFTEKLPGQPGRQVRGFGYVPDPLPAGLRRNDVILELYDLLTDAEQNLAHLAGLARRMENPAMLIGPFARKEARHSSAIENTFASERQLVLFDEDQSTVGEEKRPEVQEVSNYIQALRHGFFDKRPICLNLIREMHSLLLKNSSRMAGQPGEFRTLQNAIGDATRPFEEAKFVPPPPTHVRECLESLETYINTKDDMPRLVRIALAHYQFECIHPFDDGNGRLGRLLIALQLVEDSQLKLPLVYVSGFLEKNRDIYYRLLYSVSSNGTWIDWIRFLLSAITMQAHDTSLRVQLLDKLRSEYHSRVRQKRASAMLPTLVDHLFAQPAMTVSRAASLASMTPVSAGNLLDHLERAGIVREATGRKRSRVFVADGILEVMDVEFGEDGEPLRPPQTQPAAAS